MDRNETIDFLHALWQQRGTEMVNLDGRDCSVGTICLNAIHELEWPGFEFRTEDFNNVQVPEQNARA